MYLINNFLIRYDNYEFEYSLYSFEIRELKSDRYKGKFIFIIIVVDLNWFLISDNVSRKKY